MNPDVGGIDRIGRMGSLQRGDRSRRSPCAPHRRSARACAPARAKPRWRCPARRMCASSPTASPRRAPAASCSAPDGSRARSPRSGRRRMQPSRLSAWPKRPIHAPTTWPPVCSTSQRTPRRRGAPRGAGTRPRHAFEPPRRATAARLRGQRGEIPGLFRADARRRRGPGGHAAIVELYDAAAGGQPSVRLRRDSVNRIHQLRSARGPGPGARGPRGGKHAPQLLLRTLAPDAATALGTRRAHGARCCRAPEGEAERDRLREAPAPHGPSSGIGRLGRLSGVSEVPSIRRHGEGHERNRAC